MSPVHSTIIISVYKDTEALGLILGALKMQTTANFEVIVSEDGNDSNVKQFIQQYTDSPLRINHLTQDDDGFRKNIALNRAITASRHDHIIFIDGDCIPHTHFISAHQQFSAPGIACTGRRLELGENMSSMIRHRQLKLSCLTGRLNYLRYSFKLQKDMAKNIESGLYCPVLHQLTKNREIRLLGCNFSCHKDDLLRINGFNEDYKSPGIGEDSDIDLRLTRAGVKIRNVKFGAIQYHLYHPRRYQVSDLNRQLLEAAEKSDDFRCIHGLVNCQKTSQ